MAAAAVAGAGLFALVGDRWERIEDDCADPVVVDSWLVDDGRVRGLSAHVARFVASCARSDPALGLPVARVVGGGATDDSDAVFGAIRALWPDRCRWFPRLEAGAFGIRLRVRPAPPQGGPLVVAVAADPRRRPRVKGPDLAALARVHADGAAVGADEVLLLGPDGAALEGTRTALLWWRDGILHRPPAGLPILPSVTADLLGGLADEAGVEMRSGRADPALLAAPEVETWLVNALHGIRPVRAWLPGRIEATGAARGREAERPAPRPVAAALDAPRIATWQEAWRALGE